MALVDSEAAFSEHCASVGAPASVIRALRSAGITTFAGLAFSCGTPQNPPSDETFREFATTLFAAEPSIGEMAALRRIQFEASTLMVAHVKSQVNQDAAGSDAVRKIPAAEKQQRLRDQKARLGGVTIEGETEPSYALIDLVNSMVDNNCVLWIPPSKCGKRESEIQMNTKDKPQTLILESQTVKVAAPSVDQNIDTTSEMTLQWCLQRRGIAFDQSRLISWSTHQTWMQQLLTTLSKDPPEGYGRVKIEQVVKADRELFTIMANEIKGSLRPLPTGILPMDEAMKQLRVDPRVTMHLLPLPKNRASGSDKRSNEDVVNPKSDPKLKAPKPKKPPTKKAAAMCPDELKGHHQRDESNENICWAFNLTNGCKTKGARCPKGVHKCAKCLRTNHGLATCRVAGKKTA